MKNENNIAEIKNEKTLRPLFIGLYDTNLLGIRYLSSTLKSHGYTSNLIFLKTFNSYNVDEPTPTEYELLYKTIKELNPSYIGISIMCSFYLNVVQNLVDKIREITQVPILIGGAYATLFPEECLKLADVVFRGESEETIVEFTDALHLGQQYSHIDGIATNTQSGPKLNPIRPLIQDLDRLPHPDFGGENMYYINNDKVLRGDPEASSHRYELTTSRGCPNRCSYCSNSSIRDLYAGKGPFIRQRSVEDVMTEIAAVKKRNSGLQLLRFWDEIFPWNKEWIAKFAEAYKSQIGLPFEIWGHPRLSANAGIKDLVRAGLSKIVIGVQSGCPKIRKEIYTRSEKQEEILNCSKILSEAKVPMVVYDFILGHPFETEEDLKETLALCRSLSKPFTLQLHGLSFLPGTPIEEIAVSKGVKTWEEIKEEQSRPLREQYHSMAWWRQGHGANSNEKVYWYTLIYLTQFPRGEGIIRRALKNEKLKENPRRLLFWHKVFNFRQRLQMGWRKLVFMIKGRL
ncbi:MAG: B12-binding domain-containing radical SAM protein [Defluviitaleaceae bacterium]|nr:B12-binding domain-containing radical SAM protein [Defluviitaleaceae bacterium]